jgi:hypothetical protein
MARHEASFWAGNGDPMKITFSTMLNARFDASDCSV